jgi:hypothetical protein
MKKTSLAALSATMLALIFAVSVPMYAQDEEKPAGQEDKPAQQEEKHQAQKPEEDKNVQRQDKQIREEKQVQNDQQVREEKSTQREEKQVEHNHGRIPEDRFRANFGRTHVFVINRPVIVEGAPRFQYGGYWFVIGGAWPVGWAYTDQVYVDLIDGEYYLLSPVHPGVQVAINLVL